MCDKMVLHPTQILTKDSVTVTVDAVVYFRVSDPLIAINNAINYEWATRLLAKTTLRNVLGAHSLAEILSEKDAIAGQMRVSPTLSVCSVHWEGLRRQLREHLRGWPRRLDMSVVCCAGAHSCSHTVCCRCLQSIPCHNGSSSEILSCM